MRVEGLSDGKHAVHIHRTAACESCGAAGGDTYGDEEEDLKKGCTCGLIDLVKDKG